MRQATGSNTPQSGNKVSIQLSLDGHSFSVPALSELPAGEAPVTVELLLPGTMLVPGELFDAERGAEMLAANGMPPTAEESVVASDPEAEFVAVTAINREALRQVEEKLGRKLKTADLQVLAGLYDDLGMPADVIYLLVNHCITRSEERYGPGRRPTLRQIEKEGYYWARQGLVDQDSAARYLKTWREKQQGQAAYMQVLGLGQRRPVASEEKYISDWMDKGFPPETAALAYDKTIFYKKQLEWRYLNGILRRWHENGWHTPEEVQQGDAGKPAQPSPKPDKPDQDNSRMEKYMKW